MSSDENKFVMYVDASGDDGVKFPQGSSTHYAVSCFLMPVADKQHNLDILAKIKYLIGAKPTDEVKYCRLHRHPKSSAMHELLKQARGTLDSAVVFKQELMVQNSKILSILGGFSHAKAISCLSKYFSQNSQARVSIYIDRMKKSEVDVTEVLVKYYNTETANLPQHEIHFVDSKADGHELIQMADIFAGLTRRYFEESGTNAAISKMVKICPICRRVSRQKLCQSKASSRARSSAINQLYMNKVMHLHSKDKTNILFFPREMRDKYYYLDCYKK